MSVGTIYSNRRGDFNPSMREEERTHAYVDFNVAEETKTDEAKLAWINKWGRRVADHLAGPK